MTIKFNVQFEVPFEVTEEQLHEDLCKTLHEDINDHGPEIEFVDIGFPVEEPTCGTNVDITEWDNRDPGTTWLWIDKVRYIEVAPNDVMRNMIENCYNEDVLFLYAQFMDYLDSVVENISDIKDDTKTDHIKGFSRHLLDLIESNMA